MWTLNMNVFTGMSDFANIFEPFYAFDHISSHAFWSVIRFQEHQVILATIILVQNHFCLLLFSIHCRDCLVSYQHPKRFGENEIFVYSWYLFILFSWVICPWTLDSYNDHRTSYSRLTLLKQMSAEWILR